MASFGRGGGRGGGGGRHHHHSNRFHGNNNNNPANTQQQQQPKLQVCRNYIATGSCPHGPRCNFSHVIRHYATLDVSDKLPPSSSSSSSGYHHHQNNNRNAIKDRFKATSIAIWETATSSTAAGSGGGIKLFVSSQDGKWRLYNTTTTSTNQHHHNPHSTPHLEMNNNNNNNNNNNTGAPALVLSLQQEFEHYVGGPIDTLHLLSNTFLFVGFEISSPIEAPLENNRAGMIHVWNLGRPSDAPLECMMHGSFAKYASSGKVRCLCTTTNIGNNTTTTTTTTTAGTTTGGGLLPPRVWSGGNDGVIREWSVAPPGSTGGGGGFVLVRSMSGHLGAVTKLTLSNNNGNVLWSGGVDGTIRLWNVDGNNGEMAYLIPAVKKETTTSGAAAMDPTTAAAAAGHSAAITGLLPFEIPSSSSSNPTTTGGASSSAGSSTTNASSSSCFIFSSSLDETVKVWNATNGSCVASERHGQGVTSIAFTTDASGTHPLLLCGLYYGDIMIRGTISNPPLCLLLKISHNFVGVGHELGPVHDIQAGPGCTFYAVGEDGKLTFWQIVGDFGL